MKLKRTASVLMALVILLACASSLVMTSFATLLPIQEYEATLDLSGYSSSDLKQLPISTVLEGLKYRYDYDIPTSGENVTHVSAGDSIVIDSSATKVWVEYNTYDILDSSSVVDLSNYSDNTSYNKNVKIIVGSGKQLDPNNVRYSVTVHVTPHNYALKLGAKPYTLDENGEKQYIAISSEDTSSNNGNKYVYNNLYVNKIFANDEKIYLECNPSVVYSDDEEQSVEADISIVYDGNYSDEPNRFSLNSREGRLDATVTVKEKGNASVVLFTSDVSFYLYGTKLDYSSGMYYVYSIDQYNTRSENASYSYRESSEFGKNTCSFSREYELRENYYTDYEYNYRFYSLYCFPSNTDISSSVTKAVVGNYASSAEAADAPDIKTDLFSGNYNGGYKTNYSNGVDFTIFIDSSAVSGIIEDDATEYVMHLNIKVKGLSSTEIEDPVRPGELEPITTPDITNAYFYLNNVYTANGAYIPSINLLNRQVKYAGGTASYLGNYDLDSIIKYNYQTVLLYEEAGSDIDMTKLKLSVSSPENVNVFNSVSSAQVKFDQQTQDLSNGTVQYTVAATGGQGNYFVNVVKNTTGGAKLFVNGPDKREIFLNNYYCSEDEHGNYYHDILVANIGDQELTGLNVEWAEAPENIKLDGYWVVGGENNSTLAAFDLESTNSVSNLAKIRLVQDGEGKIKGKLKISADGQEPKFIELTGTAGNPKIVTNPVLVEGVKYVPYYAVVATDNIYEWNKVTFSLYSGRLPRGVEFDELSGQIYGVPQETGNFRIYVKVQFSHFPSIYQNFTLNVLENTNDNVYNASDENYTLTQAIGTEASEGAHDFVLNDMENDQLFVSSGTYGDFIDLWINGKKMTRNVDYTSEEGSTRITVKSQTLKALGNNSGNTIAAEFRLGGSLKNELKRTAQNFKIDTSSTGGNTGGNTGENPGGNTGENIGGNTGGNSGNNHSGGSSGGSSRPVTENKPSIDGTNKTWSDIALDIAKTEGKDEITIKLNGTNKIPVEVIKAIAENDKKVRFEINSVFAWTVDGAEIKTPAKADLTFAKKSEQNPEGIRGVVGTHFKINDTGIPTNLEIVFRSANAGKFANLYKLENGKQEFVGTAKIGADGKAVLNDVSESGEYIVMICEFSDNPGDMNNDGIINSMDSLAILKHFLDVENGANTLVSDMNNDGWINAKDALITLKKFLGIL